MGPLLPLPPVQPPAPKELQITNARDHFLLTWSMALGDSQSHWLSNLEFEVVYRRLQDSWEVGTMASSAPSPQGCSSASTCPTAPLSRQDAPTLRSDSFQTILGPEHLLPSSTYVARVRARLAPGSGLSGRPSQWSPEVRWDSQPGNEVELGRPPSAGRRLLQLPDRRGPGVHTARFPGPPMLPVWSHSPGPPIPR